MKYFLMGLFMTINSMASETSTFNILPGKLHKGGFLTATPQVETNSENILVDFNYEIKKKDLVPVPSQYLKGNYQQKLPAIFLDERGYLELEKSKSMHIDDATVFHMGRTNLNGLNDAHLIRIVTDNKKSEMLLTYHPTTQAQGWDHITLTLHTDLPLLNDYVIEGKLR